MSLDALQRLLDGLHEAAAAARHRRLLVLEAQARALPAAAHTVCPDGARWIGHLAPSGVEGLPPDRAGALLGTEVQRVVLDFTQRISPDALAAAAGAVVAGGLVVLAVPPGWGAQDPLAARCRRLWRGAPGVVWARLEAPPPPPEVVEGAAEPGPTRPWRTPGQARAVAAVERLVRGRKRRPLVLTADRGRGKSAALGLAVGRLLQDQPLTAVITGPSAAAVAPALRHAAQVLGVSVRGNAVKGPGGGGFRFVPAGELWADPPEARLVLVDEAATLPVPLLTGLLDRHPRIGFATTTHGYEGTGRGFALRFTAALDARTPGWRAVQLETPIRYAAGDPVEAAVRRALCLDAHAAPDEAVAQRAPSAAHVEWPDRAALAQDDRRLGQAFGLLVDAHYRTTPSDLHRLLADPAYRLALLCSGDHVVGAAVVADEGGLGDRAGAIAAGTGRAKGHLLPQSLAAHLGLADALPLRAARVQRIAVHPAAQRQGLGGRLLAAVVADARRRGLDYVGTSFGASAGLLRFWQVAGLQPVRLGVRPGKSSGLRAAMALLGLSGAGCALVAQARAVFADELPHALAGPLRDAPEDVAWALASGLGAVAEPTPADAEVLAAVLAGARGFDVAVAPVWRAVWALVRSGRPAPPAAGRALIVQRILQRQPWSALGGAAAQRALRDVLSEWLSPPAPPPP